MKRSLALGVALAVGALFACKEGAKKQLYFDDLKPPLGVGKVTVVEDTSLNPETGGEISVSVQVEPNVDKDELDNLMRSFHRQAARRRGFITGRPEKIDMRFYTSKKAAEAKGDDWVARVEQISSSSEPTFTNKQKAPLIKWAKQALKPSMPMFTKEHKPQVLGDPNTMVLEVTWPYVADDGSGQWVEELSYTKVYNNFRDIVDTMFTKIEGLKKLTFVGKHKDQVIMRVWLTADQYKSLDMQQTVEQEINAYAGAFVQKLMNKEVTEKVYNRKVAKRTREVFRKILSRLPEEQVEVHKKYR